MEEIIKFFIEDCICCRGCRNECYAPKDNEDFKKLVKEKLTAFKQTTKEEFLKRILPKMEETYQTNHNIIYDERNCGYNDCRNDLVTNAEKDGVTLINIKICN
jgi:hypothetical protein